MASRTDPEAYERMHRSLSGIRLNLDIWNQGLALAAKAVREFTEAVGRYKATDFPRSIRMMQGAQPYRHRRQWSHVR